MDNEILAIGETIRFKSPKGYTIYEFHRLGSEEDYMSDTVEYFKYDSRKKTKGNGAWIMLKNLPEWISGLERENYVKF